MLAGEAARHIGVDRSALGRWVAAGYVKPSRRTVGGQYRWDLDELEEQLRIAQRDDAGPPFALADAPRHPDEPR